jgi:hypothetical protein
VLDHRPLIRSKHFVGGVSSWCALFLLSLKWKLSRFVFDPVRNGMECGVVCSVVYNYVCLALWGVRCLRALDFKFRREIVHIPNLHTHKHTQSLNEAAIHLLPARRTIVQYKYCCASSIAHFTLQQSRAAAVDSWRNIDSLSPPLVHESEFLSSARLEGKLNLFRNENRKGLRKEREGHSIFYLEMQIKSEISPNCELWLPF